MDVDRPCFYMESKGIGQTYSFFQKVLCPFHKLFPMVSLRVRPAYSHRVHRISTICKLTVFSSNIKKVYFRIEQG